MARAWRAYHAGLCRQAAVSNRHAQNDKNSGRPSYPRLRNNFCKQLLHSLVGKMRNQLQASGKAAANSPTWTPRLPDNLVTPSRCMAAHKIPRTIQLSKYGGCSLVFLAVPVDFKPLSSGRYSQTSCIVHDFLEPFRNIQHFNSPKDFKPHPPTPQHPDTPNN